MPSYRECDMARTRGAEYRVMQDACLIIRRSETDAEARVVKTAIGAIGRDGKRRAHDIAAIGQSRGVERQDGLRALVEQVVGAKGDLPTFQQPVIHLQIGDRSR